MALIGDLGGQELEDAKGAAEAVVGDSERLGKVHCGAVERLTD